MPLYLYPSSLVLTLRLCGEHVSRRCTTSKSSASLAELINQNCASFSKSPNGSYILLLWKNIWFHDFYFAKWICFKIWVLTIFASVFMNYFKEILVLHLNGFDLKIFMLTQNWLPLPNGKYQWFLNLLKNKENQLW